MTTDTTTNGFQRAPESVAVVGAGPTGVMLAIELARRGVNVKRPVRVRFDGLDTPYPFVLNLRQDVTQRILDRHLERQGITVQRGIEVTDMRQDAVQTGSA